MNPGAEKENTDPGRKNAIPKSEKCHKNTTEAKNTEDYRIILDIAKSAQLRRKIPEHSQVLYIIQSNS